MTQLTAYRRYVVKGRVQGVGFRWFVEREAQLLGVGGWVRNSDDGSVELLVMGTHQQHSALYERLQLGPRAARVDIVEVEEAAPFTGYKIFQIEETR